MSRFDSGTWYVVDWHKYAARGGRPTASEWAALRSAVFERDDYTCRYCGERGKYLECDHVDPVSRGGSNDESNLVTACKPCNRAKRNHTLEEMGWNLA